MENYINNYDIIISLGSNCYPKKFKSLFKSEETHFFDWLGSSMWAVCNLIETNFDNVFFDNDSITKLINYKTDKEPIIMEKKYYLRIIHDDIKINDNNLFIELKKKYNRRGKRFMEILNSLKENKKILFIRLQEYVKGKVIYPDYIDKFKIDEKNYVIKLSNLLKTMFGNNFRIIYINDNYNYYDENTNIIYIRTQITKLNWDNADIQIKNLLNNNLNLLKKSAI